MEKLHRLDYCPEFAHDMLKVIEDGLLKPDKGSRWDCSKIVAKMNEIRQKCDDSAAYCLDPKEWKGKAGEPLPVSVPRSPAGPKPAFKFPNSDSLANVCYQHHNNQYGSIDSDMASGQVREGRSRAGSRNNAQPSPTSTRPPLLRSQSTPPPASPRESLSRERPEQELRKVTTRTPSPHQETRTSPSQEQATQIPNTYAVPPPLPPGERIVRSTGTTSTGKSNTDSQAPMIGRTARPRAGKARRRWEDCKKCVKGAFSCFRSR